MVWSAGKNDELKEKNDRPSFEQILEAISNGGYINTVKNNSKNHPNQFVIIVRVPGFFNLIAVPYRDHGHYFQLITAMPDRRLLKKYGGLYGEKKKNNDSNIEKSLMEGKYVELPELEEKKLKNAIVLAAKETLKKNAKEFRTNVRISNHDKKLLDQRAEREGFGYQTLITSLIHRFVTGKLVDIEDAQRIFEKTYMKAEHQKKKVG